MDTPQTVDTSGVVTSQSMAQFYADPPADVVAVLNERVLPDEQPIDNGKGSGEVTGEVAKSGQELQAATGDDDAQDDNLDKGSFKARIKEVTDKRKAAEAKAETEAKAREDERAARQKAEIELDALRAKYEPPKTTLSPKPVADNFVSTDDFAKAMELWATEKAEFEFTRKQREAAVNEHRANVEKAFKTSVETAKKDIADFDEVVTKSTVMLSDEAMSAIREDDNAGLLVYHLAQNPDIAEKLTKLSVPAMNREIGKLSAKLEKPAEQQKPALSLASISKAPAPISPSRGVASGSGTYDTAKMSFAQYEAARNSGKLK